MEMSLSEFYALLEEDNRKYEAWRKRKPCCANCKNYYMDYGIDCCKKFDCVPEDVLDIDEQKCTRWE